MICGVLVYDQKATAKAGRMVTRLCGAKAGFVVQFKGDSIFAVCQRHNKRLERAGILGAPA